MDKCNIWERNELDCKNYEYPNGSYSKDITYDRIQLVEENTNEEFDFLTKLRAESNELGNIVVDELNGAVKDNWEVAKHTPKLLLLAGLFVVLSYSNINNLKKVF